jgi:hypothetical protein
LPIEYDPAARYSPASATVTAIPVAQVKRVNRDAEVTTESR